MIKKYLVSLLAVFIFSFSIVGSYAQAQTANPTAPQKILEGMFAGVVTAVGATTAIGIKAKEMYDDNKQAIYDRAVQAYNGMSNAAKESWAAAVARGKTGAEMSQEVWSSISGSLENFFAEKISTAQVNLPYTIAFTDGWLRLTTKDNSMYFSLKQGSVNIINTFSPSLYFSDVSNSVKYGSISYPIKSGLKVVDLYPALQNVKSAGGANSILSNFGLSLTLQNADGSVVVGDEFIYDQALKRALETDIPRAKDAGLVIPAPDITIPSTGQRVKYDANTGTLTLPDGSIYTGDGTDLSLGLPTVGVSPSGDVVWQDGKTNTDVWTGTKTDPITGDVVTPGEGAGTIDGTITGKLDGILDGIKDIPASIGALLTKLFLPVGSIAAFADLTDTLRSRLVLPDFGWLVTNGIVCTEDGKDIKITYNGKTTTFVDMSWLYSLRTFYMPVMRGFLWFLFGWYAYRKIIAITNKVDGIKD